LTLTRPTWPRPFVSSALLAGALDITYAIVFSYFRSGVAPSRILQSVASGALGRAAYDGGTRTAALGLALHFLIAFIITAIYFLAASGQRWLTRRPLLTGAVYGLGVYGVMNLVVIPLSAIGTRPHPAAISLATGVLVHMFCIGVPIAFGARRAFAPAAAPFTTSIR